THAWYAIKNPSNNCKLQPALNTKKHKNKERYSRYSTPDPRILQPIRSKLFVGGIPAFQSRMRPASAPINRRKLKESMSGCSIICVEHNDVLSVAHAMITCHANRLSAG